MTEAQKSFLKTVNEVQSFPKACQLTGITRVEFYAWMQSDPEFAKVVSRSPLAAELVVEDALFIKSLQGDTQAMRLFFDRREEEESDEESYIDRQLKIIGNLHK